MSTEDLPMISPSSDSTQVEVTPQKEVRVNVPEPRRNPTTQVPRTPPAAPPVAARPVAPVVRAPIPQAAAQEDEDPEKLLREYADRQKTKVVRLEQQLVEYKKVVGERDGLRAKVEAMSKELQDAKRQIEASAKSEEMIKDLQGKVDAAVLSNSILAEDKEKLKKGLAQQTDHFTKAQERAEQAEKSLSEVQDQLVRETQGREEAEAKVTAAIKALQSDASPVKPATKPISEAVTRPMKSVPTDPPPVKFAEEKKDEKAATPPPKQGPGPQQRPPGRFSFLKK
jgi:predicted  nucleic acid-binding Zn-ribbon protein